MKVFCARVVTVFAVLSLAAAASAATVSGTITDTSGAGLADMEVRLWEQTDKGYSIAYVQMSASDGAYSFGNVAAGNYKLDARMAPGITGHYGDTWYDVDPPTSNGLFAADADVLEIEQTDVFSGLDIMLPLTGGFDGQIRDSNSNPLSGVVVRAESRTDWRYHHNDFTDGAACCGGSRNGRFSMRGLISTNNGHDYRLLVYDFSGVHDLLIAPGPIVVTNGAAVEVGTFDMSPMASDPNEPNDAAADATDIPVLPYTSSNAIIAPRGSDVDWYCLDADDGDRFVARVDTTITVDNTNRPHPWLDPILGLWSGDGSQLLQWNDDDPDEDTLASVVDTGELGAGRYCFVVSTYGDADWSGAQQQTAGRYRFEVDIGNRAPWLEVTHLSNPVPEPPQTISIQEDEQIVFDLAWGDPDGDPLQPEVIHHDNTGQPVLGTLTAGSGGGTYEWTPSQTAAEGSPYELTFRVRDAEFSATVVTNVEVEAVNLPPTTPVLESPIDAARVDVAEVPLVVANSSDRDGDALTYEYELHEGAPDGDADQSGSAAQDPSGSTTWTTAAITENALVSWRARAFDGNAQNGYSPWSDWETFVVDTVNEAPDAPQILKPEPDQVVPTASPRISSSVPEDPEGDPLVIFFEVGADADFQQVLAASDPVEATDASSTVEWTTDPALDGDQQYFARAKAADDRGAESAWSAAVPFRVLTQDDGPLTPPGFAGSLAGSCGGEYSPGDSPDSLTVTNVDESGDEISFEVQILRWQDGDYTQTVFETTVPQSDGDETDIPIDASVFDDDGDYRIRVRTVRGDQHSDWGDCDTRVGEPDGGPDGGDGGADPGAEEDGCGCSSSGPQDVGWAGLVLLVWAACRGARRRYRTRRGRPLPDSRG